MRHSARRASRCSRGTEMLKNCAPPLTAFAMSLSFDRLRTIGKSSGQNTKPIPFGLSLSFDRLRMIGNFAASSTSTGSVPSTGSGCTGTPFDRLRTVGNTGSVRTGWVSYLRFRWRTTQLRMIGNSNTQNTNPPPFGLSLPFDRLRTIGNSSGQNTKPIPFGLSLSKPPYWSEGTSTGSARTG
jgi:hypothetical protein